MSHTALCVELALMGIAENNEATKLTEPGRELTPETREMALEWLANGNAACYEPELCEGTMYDPPDGCPDCGTLTNVHADDCYRSRCHLTDIQPGDYVYYYLNDETERHHGTVAGYSADSLGNLKLIIDDHTCADTITVYPTEVIIES